MSDWTYRERSALWRGGASEVSNASKNIMIGGLYSNLECKYKFKVI